MAHEDRVNGAEVDLNEDDQVIEVVELEDEDGGKEEYAILDEVDFEGKHFAVLAPLAEVKALQAASEEEVEESSLSVEIFEVEGDDFTILTDEDLGKRLMDHLESLAEGQ